MNPLLAQALGAIVRWLLAFVSGWLVQRGIWTEADATQYVAAAAIAIVALGWSLWQKYKSRIHFRAALEMPAGTTEAKVAERVKLGGVLPIVLLAVALAASGCAGKLTPLKQAQITKSSLDAAFDLEASLCWGVSSVHLAPTDRTRCTAPTARVIGLTDARHQAINRGFVRAYTLHYDATRLLKAGQNADLVELTKAIGALVSELLALQQTHEVVTLVNTAKAAEIRR
jgi:hypothetical protein